MMLYATAVSILRSHYVATDLLVKRYEKFF